MGLHGLLLVGRRLPLFFRQFALVLCDLLLQLLLQHFAVLLNGLLQVSDGNEVLLPSLVESVRQARDVGVRIFESSSEISVGDLCVG